MIPASFEYIKAQSVAQAIELMGKHGADAKLLAGGHSLLPTMKLRLAQPKYLIDIGHINDLNYIREENDDIAIGAMTPHAVIESSDLVSKKANILTQAAAAIGDVQVRNRGTIGGSIAHADPAADYPASLLVVEAKIVAESPRGKRTIAISDFFVDLFTTALEADEIIVEIRVPIVSEAIKAHYLKLPHPASGFPIVGCAVMVKQNDGVCEDIRLAFTAVANCAFREPEVESALKGKALDDELIKTATDKVAEQVEPLEDHYASAQYRRHLAKVYARKALAQVR